MKYDEVKALSDQFLLPCKVIYQLNSEFNCLRGIAKELKAQEELKAGLLLQADSKGDAKKEDKEAVNSAEDDGPPGQKKKKEGIHIKYFIKTSRELKEKHQSVSERIMDALGLPISNLSSIVDWKNFLKIQTILRYYTATREQYLDFWMKVSQFYCYHRKC